MVEQNDISTEYLENCSISSGAIKNIQTQVQSPFLQKPIQI
jgi:hypothetical protein